MCYSSFFSSKFCLQSCAAVAHFKINRVVARTRRSEGSAAKKVSSFSFERKIYFQVWFTKSIFSLFLRSSSLSFRLFSFFRFSSFTIDVKLYSICLFGRHWPNWTDICDGFSIFGFRSVSMTLCNVHNRKCERFRF